MVSHVSQHHKIIDFTIDLYVKSMPDATKHECRFVDSSMKVFVSPGIRSYETAQIGTSCLILSSL